MSRVELRSGDPPHVFTIFNRVAVWGLEREYTQFVVEEELKFIPLLSS